MVNNQAKVDNKIEMYRNAPKDYLEKNKMITRETLDNGTLKLIEQK